MATPYAVKYYSALIDVPTGAVLTIGTFSAAMVFLKECIPDSWIVNAVNDPNYMGWLTPTPFFLSLEDPEEYPKWTWDHKVRKLVKTKKEFLDDRLLEHSRLAVAKGELIAKIMGSLSSTRMDMLTGVNFQDNVYAEKAAQAKAFKASDYDEDRIFEFLYVLQYADYAGISLKQAADDILLKRSFDEEKLAKTELIRLKYFNRVKEAQDVATFPDIYADFMKDTYRNALI